MRRAVTGGILASLLVLLGGAHAGLAQEPGYAPLDQPGPALRVPLAELEASLTCDGALDGSRAAVLLIHGTNLDYETNFGWNYQRQFAALGWPHCGVDLPKKGMDDIQVAAEHVVHAVRTVAARTGRPVQIVGFSQGGMIGRWALRFWPDTRDLVEEVVGLAPSNHGTLTAIPTCNPSCVPAYQQQRADSRFVAALNSRALTFGGVDYSVIYTRTDWVVTPNHDGSASSLPAGPNAVNVAIQDICPGDSSEHLHLGSFDAVGYALVHDALTHDGPVDPARIAPTVCAEPYMPGVDPATFAGDYAAYLRQVGEAYQETEAVTEEPPLACYVTASCAEPAGQPPTGAEAPPAAPALPATGGGGLAGAALLAAAAASVRRLRR
ncbi:MAG TPA: hypothetical protein VNU01_00470 [Egibacteraceae bacterium]|nr:hypothetical protein [Egibacteraceae bacterium]